MLKETLAALRELITTHTASYLRRLPPLNDPNLVPARKGEVAIHSTATVSPDAELGPDVIVGPYAVVEARARIGSGTQIGAHCVVKRFTSIGAGNRIYPQAVLGEDPQDVAFAGEESFATIGDENIIREGVTIHRACGERCATIVGSRNYLLSYVHIGHDSVIGDRVGIGNRTIVSGHVQIQDDAFVSGGVGIMPRCRIGRGAMVGGMSKVTQDVLPYCLADGAPARLIGLHTRALRRAEVPPPQIARLKEAYRLLSGRGPNLDERLRAMSGLHDPLVDEMVAFIRASTRGFCRGRRVRTANAAADLTEAP